MKIAKYKVNYKITNSIYGSIHQNCIVVANLESDEDPEYLMESHVAIILKETLNFKDCCKLEILKCVWMVEI